MMRFCWVILLAATAGLRFAEAAEAGAIVVRDGWARATTAAAKAGGAFVTIANTGPTADKLVSAATEIAERTELHASTETDGVMKMREVGGGIPLPAGQAVELRPGGYHVMLMGLRRPLVAGESFPLALTFERAGPVRTEIQVKPANHRPGAAHGRHGTH